MIHSILSILPTAPSGDLATLAKTGTDFFGLWISRLGGLVAFVGAVKFALATKDDDAKDQLLGVLIMISGFMIRAAVGNLDLFNIPSTYSEAAANTEFQSILKFIGRWTRRVGAVGMVIGATMFGFAIRANDAGPKVTGMKTFAAGAMVVAVSGILHTFV